MLPELRQRVPAAASDIFSNFNGSGALRERHSSIAPPHIRAQRAQDNLTSSSFGGFTWNSGSGSADNTGSTQATSISDLGEETDSDVGEPGWPFWFTEPLVPNRELSEDDIEDLEWAAAEVIASGDELILLAQMTSLQTRAMWEEDEEEDETEDAEADEREHEPVESPPGGYSCSRVYLAQNRASEGLRESEMQ